MRDVRDAVTLCLRTLMLSVCGGGRSPSPKGFRPRYIAHDEVQRTARRASRRLPVTCVVEFV
jgi:hypothetical protein